MARSGKHTGKKKGGKKRLPPRCGPGDDRSATTPGRVLTRPDVMAMVLSLIAIHVVLCLSGYLDVTGTWIQVLILGMAIVLLLSSSERFLVGAKGIARNAGIAEVIIGLTIVSVGTSLPEILTTSVASHDAMMYNDPTISDFALGNIYGSDLVQITMILGLVAFVVPITVHSSWVRRDGLVMIGAVVLLTLFIIFDRTLQRYEAIILIVLYFTFIGYLVKNREMILRTECEEKGDALDYREVQEDEETGLPSWSYCVMVAAGLALAIHASDLMVGSAIALAKSLGVAKGAIGLTVSAIGTSLPELSVGLVAARRSKGIAIGTLVGSNITDPMLSIGIAGTVNPISMSPESADMFVYLTIPYTILACVIAVLMMRTRYVIERWEGIVLMAMFVAFIAILVNFL